MDELAERGDWVAEAEDLPRIIVDQASDAIIFADPEGVIRLWNSAAEEIFGFSSQEVSGKTLDVIIPEQLRSAHWTGFKRAMQEGRTKYARIPLTMPACHKTKEVLYIDLTFSIIKTNAGRVVGAQAAARDVTERYLTERALREGTLALGFVSLDSNWTVTNANEEALRILGGEFIVGRALWDQFPTLIGSPFYEKVYLSAAEQKPIHFECFIPALNAWLEVHAYPSPAGVVLWLRNINRAKYLEEKLERSEQMFRLLVEQARDYAIIIYDAQGTITNWNRGAERLYRYRGEEIVGSHYSRLNPHEEPKEDWPDRIFRKALEGGSAQEECWRARKDGSRFLALIVVTALRDSGGRLQGFSSVTRDITKEREAELERARLLKEAQDAVSSRDELLSIAAHEIKTPLTAINLQLQMLRRTAAKQTVQGEGPGVAPPTLKMIESCEKQSQRLARMLDELLDVTRIRLGKLSLDLQETNLSEIAMEAVERFSLDATKVGSTLTTNLYPSANGFWDAGRLEEIANNLISNAIKYGAGKPIEIITMIDEGASVARLTVKDEGIGIPADMIDAIFKRFERVNTSQKIKGVGLGLYVTRQLVEAHGGTIRVQTALGKGSTFTVELPLRPSQIEGEEKLLKKAG